MIRSGHVCILTNVINGFWGFSFCVLYRGGLCFLMWLCEILSVVCGAKDLSLFNFKCRIIVVYVLVVVVYSLISCFVRWFVCTLGYHRKWFPFVVIDGYIT